MTNEYSDILKKELGTEIRETIMAGGEATESEYINKGIEYLKALYTGAPVRSSFHRRYFKWCSDDLDNVVRIWEEIKEEIEEFVAACIKKNKSNRMVREINQLTAEALITKTMEEAGLKHIFIPQAYRAKIIVKMNEKNKVLFYISYKKLNEELPKAVENIKAIIGHLDSLGSGASILKMLRYETW